MKKLLLTLGCLTLFFSIALRAYFELTPPPEPTLERELSEIVPDRLSGWKVRDMDIADSPESSARVGDFLKYDDFLVREFKRGETFVTLYIAYWTPGKVPYRWAGAHTPDTCWVLNGWTQEDRKYNVPLENEGQDLKPAEFGVYEKDGEAQKVYFWHMIGDTPFGYKQKGRPNIFGALEDVRQFGFNLRQEQFFVRLSSNRDLEELKKMPEFNKILDSLEEIGLAKDAPETGER